MKFSLLPINGFSASLFGINLSLHFNNNKKEKEPELEIEPSKKHISLPINQMSFMKFREKLLLESNTIVHLFIALEPGASWNVITPIIEYLDTGYYIVFYSCCCLQGGHSLTNTRSVFENTSESIKQGNKIKIVPWVHKNEDFNQFLRGEISFKNLKEKVIPFVNYTDGKFAAFNKTYEEYKKKYLIH